MEVCQINGKAYHMKLELVQTIFRHGERTNEEMEIKLYDSYGPKIYEPFGMGQLTNNGKQEAFKIGQTLRQVYADFLNDQYNPNDFYATSSEDDRTKMSLQLALAGLFPPNDAFEWNPDLKWMPFPVRYTPREVDVLLKPHRNKRFYTVWEETFKSPEFQKKLSVYADLFELIKRKIGKDISGLANKCYIFNALYIPTKLNVPIPDWYTEDVKKTWRKAYALIVSSMAGSLKLRKLNGGPLAKTLLENMNTSDTAVNPRKMYLFCGHDYNLYALKTLLGLSEPDFFDTGSGFAFEKWRDAENQLYIRVLVWTTPGAKPRALKVKDKEFCPIDDFVKTIDHAIPSEEEMNQMFSDLTAEDWKNIFTRDPNIKMK